MHVEASPAGRVGHGAEPLTIGGAAAVGFLGVTAGVQMSDRGLQSILGPAIREAFKVGDSEMGLLFGVAGILVASGLAMPLAKLADRYSRKSILIGLIAGWTVLTAVGAVATVFPLFFFGRAASGVTEFAMIPIVYSLIPDLVGERWRIGANLAFAALMAIGASLGFYLGGGLLAWAGTMNFAAFGGPSEPWRIAMLLLAFLGLPLMVVGLLTFREPPRGAHEASAEGAANLIDFVRSRGREILLFIGAAGGLAVAVQAVLPMAAMAVVRRFSADLNGVGHWLGLLTLVTSLFSLPVAGLLDRLLAKRLGYGSRPAIMMGAAVLAIPCTAALAGAGSSDIALALIGGFLVTTCIANNLIPTMLQDLAPAELRARAFAAYSFLIAAFCALGPVLAGGISDGVTGGDLMSAMALAGAPALALAAVCAGLALWGRRSS